MQVAVDNKFRAGVSMVKCGCVGDVFFRVVFRVGGFVFKFV